MTLKTYTDESRSDIPMPGVLDALEELHDMGDGDLVLDVLSPCLVIRLLPCYLFLMRNFVEVCTPIHHVYLLSVFDGKPCDLRL
jgi:hypothetical protein